MTQAEFYFDNESLKKQVDVRGLELEAEDIVEQQGKIMVSRRNPDIEKALYLFKPKSLTKAWFAEKVVPSLEDDEFTNFEILFEKILEIIQNYNKNSTIRECATTCE